LVDLLRKRQIECKEALARVAMKYGVDGVREVLETWDWEAIEISKCRRQQTQSMVWE